ncbi:Inner membrane ABC transporter permease protein YcjO [subsurface metagenome]
MQEKRTFWQVLTGEKYYRWLLISPLLLTLAVFMLYPTFYCIYYSAHLVAPLRPPEFVGMENFRQALADPIFWAALGRTAYVLVICIAAELILGMAVALLLNREFRGQNIVRGFCLLPLLIMPLGMSMIWNQMFYYHNGIINIMLTQIGLPGVNWFSPDMALYTIMFMSVWQWTPFSIFVLLAGLRGLPRDAFEAAKVDGASAWYTFRRLTLPMLTPLILIIVLLRTMWLIRIYDPLFGTTRGGVGTEVLDWMVYRTAFVIFDTGYGATLALISLFLTIIFCAVLYRKLIQALK